MKNRLRWLTVTAVCTGLYMGTMAYGQTANKAAKQSSSGEDEYPDLVEIDPFGGVQLNAQVQRGLTTKLVDGGVAGIRLGSIRRNIWGWSCGPTMRRPTQNFALQAACIRRGSVQRRVRRCPPTVSAR